MSWRVELGNYYMYIDRAYQVVTIVINLEPRTRLSSAAAHSSFKSLNLACARECVCVKILRFPRVDPSLVNVQQFLTSDCP